ncbi:uncharacterized protein LOC117173777 [Belonocnema kinseyi]|uniref:uncharacterized protein LOC117173777 n=1 Tax=Belonocnema kinseyi TaxID=2817044 RepID=UPI00143E02A4|nr:uncharacterized protein LOC117173777 [Belonocnema kinseyi]
MEPKTVFLPASLLFVYNLVIDRPDDTVLGIPSLDFPPNSSELWDWSAVTSAASDWLLRSTFFFTAPKLLILVKVKTINNLSNIQSTSITGSISSPGSVPQREGSPEKPIKFGRVARIPPVFERPTASNISIEQGGKFIVLSTCNRQPRLSSASRGVRSRPPEEDPLSSSKTEMIPLLTPTMESNLLKESWPIPKMKPGTVDGEDNSQNFSIWEENFQDLSGWCMNPFPEQCDFPIGEAINPKLSDTGYENEVSILEGVPEGITIVYDENRNCDDILHSADISNMQGVVKFEEIKPNCSADIKPDIWLNVTTDTTNNRDVRNDAAATTSYNSGRVKPGNLKLYIPPSQVEEVKTVDPLEPAIFSALVTNEQESFDLLSYLCDDETASPSTSTSAILEPKLVQIKELKPTSSQTVEKNSQKSINEPKKIEFQYPKNSLSPSSSSSSSFLEESIKLSERIKKAKYSSAKLGKDFCKGKRQGVKRILESESEDHENSDSSYRESREKNNEASRKSRMNKKSKEMQMASQAVQLEKANKVLKMKVEELEKLVTSLRMSLLQSAMKKER